MDDFPPGKTVRFAYDSGKNDRKSTNNPLNDAARNLASYKGTPISCKIGRITEE
jgi:hypothetical protein